MYGVYIFIILYLQFGKFSPSISVIFVIKISERIRCKFTENVQHLWAEYYVDLRKFYNINGWHNTKTRSHQKKNHSSCMSGYLKHQRARLWSAREKLIIYTV